MITQKEFEERVNKFEELEDARSQIYDMAMNLIKNGFELEAYLLILSTWNFAGFRYVLTSFDMNKFRRTISEINPIFEKLKNEKFETADFDKLKGDISFIYNKLNELVKQTGATKIMYFKNPNLFVMWDINIRKMWNIPQTHTTAEDYINFLKLMKQNFGHIKWENKETSLARAIDAYNFVVTQEIIRNKRKNKTDARN
ncbi:hypothetical protein J7K43_02530 [Candidatus Calescamantes bacterium]|nr:hypothetical protein [Candidatus Calescamantes bacterium]